MFSTSWRKIQFLLGGRILLFGSLLTILGTLTYLVLYFESASNPEFKGLGDAVWWAIVTATTTGYGDRVPITVTGKILAMATIIIGIFMMSLFTGTVASVLVEKRILRGLGMEKTNFSGHLVICGYNSRLNRLIGAIRHQQGENLPILVINQAEEEKMMGMISSLKDPHLNFLRGDYVQEEILARASITKARAAIILSDLTYPERTDERTILTALALRAANPGLRIIAEINREDNVPHLQRARVDEIICGEAYTPFILASGIQSSGIPLALSSILQPGNSQALKMRPVPEALIGKNFFDLLNFHRKKEQALAIGLVSEKETGLSLSDILSCDSSAIDQFITRKLSESEPDILSLRPHIRVDLAPEDERIITKNDWVLLLGGK